MGPVVDQLFLMVDVDRRRAGVDHLAMRTLAPTKVDVQLVILDDQVLALPDHPAAPVAHRRIIEAGNPVGIPPVAAILRLNTWVIGLYIVMMPM